MIRKRYLAACLLSLTISACSSDSDDNNSANAPLPAPSTGDTTGETDPDMPEGVPGEELDPDAMPVEGETPPEGEPPVEGEVPPEGEVPVEGEVPPEGEVPVEGEEPGEGMGPVDPPVASPGDGLIGPQGGLSGPAYIQQNDSPFANIDFSSGYFFLEDFEDALLDNPGARPNAGSLVSVVTTDAHDSVDADDGSIDGSGLNGNNWFRGSGVPSVRWSFTAAELDGNLPTHVGLVWTDGRGTIEFEAFGAQGQSLGVVTGDHADIRFDGATAEDRFYGVIDSGGISSVVISSSNTGFGLEMDHLQWGFIAP